MTSNLDRLAVSAEAKAHRDDMGRAIAPDRCKPAQPLPTEVLGLFLAEMAHR